VTAKVVYRFDMAADETEGAALIERGDFGAAATWVLRKYGSEIMTYLMSLERRPAEAEDVFSEFCVALCSGLPRFRSECSLRTYSYALARRQWALAVRKRVRRGEVPLTPELEAVAAEIRTSTAEYLRSGPKDRLAQLRENLDEEDRTLLVLRLHRKLDWREIARVLDENEAPTDLDLTRGAAALRKRFERLKDQFRRELRGDSDGEEQG
jgi:RNA polymerase sigma-70 factor (ECF subfamily)